MLYGRCMIALPREFIVPEHCLMNRNSPMSRRTVLKLAGGVAAGAGAWVVVNRHRNLVQVRDARTLMQTSVAVTAMAADEAQAHGAIRQAYRRMSEAAAVLTRFSPDSPVARLNREGAIDNAPPMLQSVMAQAARTFGHSEGDFDVTVLPVLGYYLEQPRPMTVTAGVRQAVARRERAVGFEHVRRDGSRITLARPGMAITLDGIAKGYVIDQGVEALRHAGVEAALIDAGGEIRAMSAAGAPHAWRVGIVDPQRPGKVAAVVRLRNGGLSTSGNYEVFFSSDKRLFHIINPHTGYSPDRYSSVTVVAERAVESDAASVAAFSMPLPKLRSFMAAAGHEWLVFSWDGRQRWRSRHLPMISGDAKAV